jgi:1-acyl-sn-glycerol-3-phosphate acyltransferase
VDDFKLEPARDRDLSGMDRYKSPQREDGLIESGLRLAWWLLLRGVFCTWNRLRITGLEHLPSAPSFVLVANHASHLDAPLLTSLLPLAWRDQTFPIAARDVFFERLSLAAFSAVFVNAFPIVRGPSGRHGLADVRERLLSEPSILILFPEGTRTRTGEMNRFKPGIGMLVAETSIPVVPCYLSGTAEALPLHGWFVRPAHLAIRLGPPQVFSDLPNNREGWNACSLRLEEAVRALSEDAEPPLGDRHASE